MAQHTSPMPIKQHRLGLFSGYGGQGGLRVSYWYQVQVWQLQYAYTFRQGRRWSWAFTAQPQINQAKFLYNRWAPTKTQATEFGLGLGAIFRRTTPYRLSYYLQGKVGPHYITDGLERQAKGFIFTESIFTGIEYQIRPGIYFDARLGFRHMSNGGLKVPNGGIHTLILGGGLSFQL
ncbi:MAG: acyloxyacyl hydrolase [Lewinellaceae bacterium]|nr:acyloxyacyl hydrolase [Lewinellaceae bacterium]